MDWLLRLLRCDRDRSSGGGPDSDGNGEAAQQAKRHAQKRLDDTLASQPRVDAVVRRLQKDSFGADLDQSFGRPRRAT